MKPSLLLFDLDGTLVDSRRDIVAQVNAATAAEGFGAFPDARVAGLIGRGARFLFRELLGPAVPEPRIDAAILRFKALYAEHMTDTTDAYPGAREALDACRGVPMAILTNKSQEAADALLAKLGLARHFKAVFGAEAFERRKPDPLPVLEACRRLGAPPARAALIGDSRFDMQAAKGAGAIAVAALWGYGTEEELRKHSPDIILRNPSEVPTIINGRNGEIRKDTERNG